MLDQCSVYEVKLMFRSTLVIHYPKVVASRNVWSSSQVRPKPSSRHPTPKAATHCSHKIEMKVSVFNRK